MDSQVAFRSVLLPDVTEGVCVDYIQVKVERIFAREIIRYSPVGGGPTREREQLRIVVFDKAVRLFLFILLWLYIFVF